MFSLLKYCVYCTTYTHGFPDGLVLWWIQFHTTQLSLPVVTDLPTVKIILASNALRNSCNISLPALLSGRNACLCVPSYRCPGFGWHSFKEKAMNILRQNWPSKGTLHDLIYTDKHLIWICFVCLSSTVFKKPCRTNHISLPLEYRLECHSKFE